MYRVIKHFIDLHDNDHSYSEGDIYPREGVIVSKERIEELAGCNNKQNTPLIELVEEESDTVEPEEAEPETEEPEKTTRKKGRGKTAKESQEEVPEE